MHPHPAGHRAPAPAVLLLAASAAAVPLLTACTATPAGARERTFASDLAFLRGRTETLVLTAPTGARIVIAPRLGGAVMTAMARGEPASLGAIDRAAVADGAGDAGGEDRCVLTLAAEDAPLAFTVAAQEPARVVLAARAGDAGRLAEVTREVALRDPAEVLAALGITLGADVRAVSFETRTTVTNAGSAAWSGAPARLRVDGAFAASPACRVLLPFVGGPERYHGPVLTSGDAVVDVGRSLAELRGAGARRSSGERCDAGIGPRRAKPLLGAWDDERSVLTLVEFSLPVDTSAFDAAAPVVHAALGDGTWQLAIAAPPLALPAGAQATHVQRTTHVTGPRAALATIAAHVLGAVEMPRPR